MKMLKIIAVTATLLAGATSAYAANPFDAMGGFDALNELDSARYVNVQTVNGAEARSLLIDTDQAALQSHIIANQFIAKSLADQGYDAADVVGIDGNGTTVTLYVL